jgi:hypothetical protein
MMDVMVIIPMIILFILGLGTIIAMVVNDKDDT